MAVEFQVRDLPFFAELHVEINFVAAARVITMDMDAIAFQTPVIAGFAGVVQDDLLVEVAQLVVHEKNRIASLRMSIIASISALVL